MIVWTPVLSLHDCENNDSGTNIAWLNHLSSTLLSFVSDMILPATTFVILRFRNLIGLMVQNFVEISNFHIPFFGPDNSTSFKP